MIRTRGTQGRFEWAVRFEWKSAHDLLLFRRRKSRRNNIGTIDVTAFRSANTYHTESNSPVSCL